MAAQRNNFKNKQRTVPYFTNTWKDKKQNQRQPNKPPFMKQQEKQTFSTQQTQEKGGNTSRDPPNDKDPIIIPPVPVVIQDNVRREKKFANRSRVFIGNLPRSITEDELMSLFKPYGEITQVYLEKEKNYGFARMAYRDEAVRAISALNGSEVKGREVHVRFAASSCSVKISNLHPMVSNELLHNAFCIFGEVEYATVVTDDRGKSLGHGFVDFAKKSQAMAAIERCSRGCFFLTTSPIPVSVTELIRENEEDGLPDKEMTKSKHYDYYERELLPRMAQPGTPEFNFGMKFKALYEEERKLRAELEGRLTQMRALLMKEMDDFNKQEEHVSVLRLHFEERQREQDMLEQEIRRREQFQGGSGPPLPQLMPGMPPPHMLPPPHLVPPPGVSHMMGQPSLMAPPPPQPLLGFDSNSMGGPPRGILNPLISGPPPPPHPSLPPFLLPSPGQITITVK